MLKRANLSVFKLNVKCFVMFRRRVKESIQY